MGLCGIAMRRRAIAIDASVAENIIGRALITAYG
jgi:hypothetical protein